MAVIRLYWWNGRKGPDRSNFGDALSPLLVRELARQEVRYASPARCDLVAAGSVLHAIRKASRWRRVLGRRPPIVWGSGTLEPPGADHRGLRIRAVRGPRTRDALGLPADTPLGDPGLLIDRLVVRGPRRWRWGIIPHYVEADHPMVQAMAHATPEATVINLRDPDVLATARSIAACDFVISSSLHGLITADAFGIPSIWMRLGTEVRGGGWKFADYFESVDRVLPAPLTMAGDLRLLEPQAGMAPRAAVRRRQEELVRSFPATGG